MVERFVEQLVACCSIVGKWFDWSLGDVLGGLVGEESGCETVEAFEDADFLAFLARSSLAA